MQPHAMNGKVRMIHASYRKGVFESTTPVDLPDECEIEFEPAIVQASVAEPTLNDVYAILSERYRSGEHDVAERRNEHQP